MNRQSLLIILLFFQFVSCKDSPLSRNNDNETTIHTTTTQLPDFKGYLNLDLSHADIKYYDIIYLINEKLEWENVIDTTVSVEIRFYILVAWKPTEIYRLQFKEGVGWNGDMTELDYLMLSKTKPQPFVPCSGWEAFERALVSSDFLSINAENIILPNDGRPQYLSPSEVEAQILMPTSSKIINLGSYFLYSQTYPELSGVASMDTLMHHLLSPDTYPNYYP
jgi:hypothetical protein